VTGASPLLLARSDNPRPGLRLPSRKHPRGPLAKVLLRLTVVVFLVLLSWAIVLVERDSYRDSNDGSVSVVDALYYTTVTLSTTGYGDITPVTTSARLVNALVVTPMRLIFVVLLVGTSIQALTRQSRDEFRRARWRKRVRDHIVVMGYGTKGRNAVRALVLKGSAARDIVIVEPDPSLVQAALDEGYGAIQGDATDESALREALIERARTVIVAVGRDDTAILATLTVGRLAPDAIIIASAREAQNAQLLRQSGASSVIVSSETAGRLLGLASDSPETVAVVEDLLSFGAGMDLAQRPVSPAEIGADPAELRTPILAVLRGDLVLRFDDPTVGVLRQSDRLVYVETAPVTT
jgi:voltage-gated potassium channel